MEQQTSFWNTKVRYIPTVENGIAMLSFDQKEKDKANDNRAFETDEFEAFAFRTINRPHH